MSESSEGTTSTSTAGSDQSNGAGGLPGTPQGFVPVAELEKANQRAASFQAAADRASARSDQVMKELGEVKSLMQSFDPNSIVAQVQAGIAQARALETEAVALKAEFPHATKELYDRGFATPEELRVAVEASHLSKVKEISEIRESAEADIRAELKAKHGIDLAPQSPPPSDGDKSKLTAADVANMSLHDKMALTDEQLEALSREE